MFIPGMCRVWAKRIDSSKQHYWFTLPNAARGYTDCQSLVDYYEQEWPNAYVFEITADLDLCRPL